MVRRQKQLVMKGIDTNLSRACDDHLEALEDLNKAKEYVAVTEQRLADIMEAAGKKSITHGGRTMWVRKGRVVKDSVIIKKEIV